MADEDKIKSDIFLKLIDVFGKEYSDEQEELNMKLRFIEFMFQKINEAKQEQREKDEQICEQISNKYAERSTSPLSRHNAKAKAAHLCAMKIRNGG